MCAWQPKLLILTSSHPLNLVSVRHRHTSNKSLEEQMTPCEGQQLWLHYMPIHIKLCTEWWHFTALGEFPQTLAAPSPAIIARRS